MADGHHLMVRVSHARVVLKTIAIAQASHSETRHGYPLFAVAPTVG
jgi:hypothetical protein